MRRTNVFATDEEKNDIERLAILARHTPVITFKTGEPDMATRAWKSVRKRIHKAALAHGLPEIEGYYGFDQATGEFIDND